MSTGWYKRRRGILEHIESGTIDLLESGIHDYLSLKANLVIGSPCSIPVGICFTSAPAIHVHCPRVSERTIQRCLKHLEEIGWLKTWKVPGKRGNYPVLLCRGSVADLSGKEYRINGVKTVDWKRPVYEPVGELSGNASASVGTQSGYREVRSKNREESKPSKNATCGKFGQHETQRQTRPLVPSLPIWAKRKAKPNTAATSVCDRRPAHCRSQRNASSKSVTRLRQPKRKFEAVGRRSRNRIRRRRDHEGTR